MSRLKKIKNKKINKERCELSKPSRIITIMFLTTLTIVFLFPIFIVLLNSFKGRFYIAATPFALPTGEIFVGLTNYIEGFRKTGILQAVGWSFFITIFAVIAIIILTSMTAWYIIRVKSKFTSNLYYIVAVTTVI